MVGCVSSVTSGIHGALCEVGEGSKELMKWMNLEEGS